MLNLLPLYGMVALVLAPPLLFLIGAIRKARHVSNRIVRIQLEGSALAMIGMLLKGAMFDPLVGFDPARETRFAYWFDRGESGLFVIGLILLAFGFFLERRPRPGLRPWSKAEKNVSLAGVLAGGLLAAATLLARQGDMSGWPWSPVRIGLMAGLLPLAYVYCRHAFNDPTESATAEYDVMGIEE